MVWSGFGFLVAIVGVLALLGTQMLSGTITGNENFYQENQWVILVGMVVAAAVTFALNQTLLKPKTQTVIDKETKQEVVLQKNHSLFFVPTKWWPIIFVVLGLVAAAMSFTSA